jgi:phosphohistidine phosphatase
MRRLIVLRHAKTERDSPTGRDFDRRLDERGQQDAHEIGKYLADNHLLPDLALVSPAVRARETWSQVAPHLKSAEMIFEPDLYGAEVSELLRVIAAAGGRASDPQIETLMVVAHNPGLHELSLMLIGAAETPEQQELACNLPTSGVTVIDFAFEDWGDITLRAGTLERFVSPRKLRFSHKA